MGDTPGKKPRSDSETILMALDQVSQTIDVMTSVVNRLRSYVEQQARRHHQEESGPPRPTAPGPGQTLH